jgi:hypothetical protein
MNSVIKGLLFSVLAVSAMVTSAHAFPNHDEMKANFQTCEQSDESWHRRWGQYVVAFDINAATDACSAQFPQPGIPHLAACRVNGRTLYAGYYCEDMHN